MVREFVRRDVHAWLAPPLPLARFDLVERARYQIANRIGAAVFDAALCAFETLYVPIDAYEQPVRIAECDQRCGLLGHCQSFLLVDHRGDPCRDVVGPRRALKLWMGAFELIQPA